jgi:hypothetical protein
LFACGSEAIEAPTDKPQSLSITAFATPSDTDAVTALQAAFPGVEVEVLDHLYFPDRARSLEIPSNGYASLQRLDATGEPVGGNQRIDLDLPPESLSRLQTELQAPLTTFHLYSPPTESRNPKDQFSLLRKALSSRGFQHVSLSDNPSLVVWMASQSDLSEDELIQLRNHHASGGPLLFGVEPTRDPRLLPRLNQLLNRTGVSLENGVLASDYQQVWETLGTPSSQDRYNHAASRFMAHPATGSLGQSGRSDVSVIFSHAAIISPRHGGAAQASPLLLSHREAWTEVTHDGKSGEGERSGSLPLALASDSGSDPGKVVVLADTTVFSNRWALHPGNNRFLEVILDWLIPDKRPDSPVPQAKAEVTHSSPVFTMSNRLRSATLHQRVRALSLSRRTDAIGSHVWVTLEGNRVEKKFLGNALAKASLDEFQGLSSLRSWPSPAEDRIEAMGLGDPVGELQLTDEAGQTYTLTLGGSPYNADGRYALDTERDTVHLLSSVGLNALFGPEIALEETRFLPETSWHRFEIPGDRTLRIERRDSQWILAGKKGIESRNAAKELARELLALQMADAQAIAPTGAPAFQAQFFDEERRSTRIALHQTPDGWVAFSDFSRRWGRVSPRIAERIVALADSLP